VNKIVALTGIYVFLLLLPKKSEERVKWHFNYMMKTIVIDAGHGGHDAGCHGTSAYEKNVTLSVALKLGAMLEKNLPGVKVVYTRRTDEFIELHERASVANRHKADLFISIHCNANKNTAAYGTETWTMGLHKTEGNLEVAKRENSAILMEKNYDIHYDGFDPNSPEAYIMFSLNQNAFINQSLMLASNVEEEFKKDGRFSRGVKQAGFLVLWRTTMPAILIETGFLTNRNEESYLASEKGQNELTQSIFTAIKNYKIKMEDEVNALFNTKDRTLTVQQENQPDEKSVDVKQQIPQDKPSMSSLTTPDSNPQPKEETVSNTYYSIQLAASKNPINIKAAPYTDVKSLRLETDNTGMNRVFAGKHKTKEDALKQLNELTGKGFKGCFIVGFENGNRFVVH
jgi:N-acetylmuramoyl-L-alanine amidase